MSIPPSSRSETGGEPMLLDRAHLARQTLDSRPLAIEVLGLFLEQLPALLSTLETAGAGRPWFEAAHAIKGSARAIGATRLAEAAVAAEQAAGAPSPARAATFAVVAAAARETRVVLEAEIARG